MANYSRITKGERRQISTFLEMRLSINQIAKRLDRNKSTISREIKRNSVNGKYSVRLSEMSAKINRFRRPNKLDTDHNLRNYVLKGLEMHWSPQQISGRLRYMESSFYISTESIYRYIYQHPELKLYEYLTKQRKKRRPSRLKKMRAAAPTSQRRSIENRPKNVENRDRIGHWEGDTIRFKGLPKECITTLVERTSRFVCLKKNEDGTSATVIGNILPLLKASSKKLWKSITFDNGTEFKFINPIEAETHCKVYFAHPYSPWERPTNENTNGRLRRFIKRSADPKYITQNYLDHLSNRLNNTPRKCLNYKTPFEVIKERRCCISM